MFRARVYPIPARGEKRIKVSYTEILKAERSLVRYAYPLNTERFSFRPLNSEEYFRLLFEKAGIAKYISVAKNIIVNYEGVNYKIVDVPTNE